MAAKSLPQIKIQNTGGAQSNVPFTFGHVFAPGDLAPSDGLIGGALPLQVDVKATHADGSVRHAVLSGVLPKLAAGETVTLQLAKAAKSGKSPVTTADVQGVSFGLVVTLGGKKYTAPIQDNGTPWLSGGIVGEWIFTGPLKDEAGNEHRLLQARFHVRYYPGAKQARVEFVVENDKAFTSAEKLNYDVQLLLNGQEVYSRKGMDNYHHSRWHFYAWTGTPPAVNIQLDTAYLISTRAVPNFDMSNAPGEAEIKALASSINASNTGPMTIGPVTPYMPTTGGRPDIGPLPAWAMMWLLSMDVRARDVMMAAADGAGTWSIHYRDENTGYPLRTDNDKNKDVTTHFNLRNSGPLPVPRFYNDNPDAPAGSWTPYTDDTAHQPSLVYLPYLVTGDYYYLEELHFWAASNPLGTDPDNHGHGQGLLRWLQLRGQAWSMRTLGHAAYITPDEHPMKDYFLKQLDKNLSFYTDTYVKGNPNKLGAYDGSGDRAFNDADHFAAWQDDFFTGVLGYLVGLGFQKALALLQWKAKYSVLRMTSTDFPWWLASTYALRIRDSRQSPLYGSMGEVYKATYGGDTIPNDDVQQRSAILNGKRFIDMAPCSQDQATVLGNANGYGWELGRMVGYADSSDGYPANMQPALAAAVNAGIEGAQKAWDLFESRAKKPDYRRTPQWDILPWSVAQTATVTPASAPSPPALKLTSAPGAGTWKKVGAENDKISLPIGSQIRYGAEGKGYVYAITTAKEFDASNAAFGGDPVPNVVKQVDVFAPAKPATLKTPSNTLLKKLTGLVVKVVDPKTLQIVSKFSGVAASSTGIITVSGQDMTAKAVYAVVVENTAGKVLDIMFPVTATA